MKILGALIILAGFVLFAQFQYIPAFICLVIGAIFMGKPRTPREEPEEDGQDSELVRVDAPLQKVRSTNTELRRLAFPVDEVTMNNDDGSSRQEFLRTLCGGEDMAVVDVWFDDYLFGGPGLAVVGGASVGDSVPFAAVSARSEVSVHTAVAVVNV